MMRLTKMSAITLFSAVFAAAWYTFLGVSQTAGAKSLPPTTEPVSGQLPNTNYQVRSNQSTTILYDGALGGTPDDQSFLYLNLPPGSATNTESGGVATLDTTIVNNGAYAGYFGDPTTVPEIPILDRTSGYTLTFTIQVETEAHANNDRAGFSVIVLSDDHKGIEMAFWENEIWVQNDDLNDPGDLFTHAEGVPYSTTTNLETYNLSIYSSTYTLTVANSTILTGRLRDYTNFTGPIDPYETPNFIFLGDDTTSAQARTHVSFIAITTIDPPLVNHFNYLPFIRND